MVERIFCIWTGLSVCETGCSIIDREVQMLAAKFTDAGDMVCGGGIRLIVFLGQLALVH